MVYSSSLHDSITSICKNILPFSFKKRRLAAIAAAEQQLSKLQSDNLKWQQESFHQILNLMGLSKQGILPESEVAVFRSHILDTLVASPFDYDYEQPVILRDKLIFLQELLYANCITEEEYHLSKRPLLHRLAIQGDKIDARYVIFGPSEANSTEELSVIDLKNENSLMGKEISKSKSKKFKQNSAMKQIKGSKSLFSLVSLNKYGKLKEDKGILDVAKKDLSVEKKNGGDHSKKHYRTLFQKQGNEGFGECDPTSDERTFKSAKKKSKKSDSDDETTPLSLSKKSDYVGIDKEELSRTEIDCENPNSHFLSQCHSFGSGDNKKDLQNSEKNWTTFSDDEDENCHPNLFSTNQEKFKTTLYYDDYNNSMYYNKVVGNTKSTNPFLYT